MSFLRLSSIGKRSVKKTKRKYTPELLSLAYEEIRKGMFVHKAARFYGIPDSTQRDRFRVNGSMQPPPDKEQFNTRPGPSTTLNPEEEKLLVSHCVYMASIGYGYSRTELIDLANDFAVSLKKKSVFAQSWFDGFKNRNPDITLAKPQKLSLVRAKCTSEAVLDKYFLDLARVMSTNGLLDKPENIWNIDETGLVMEHSPSKVICGKGAAPQSVTSNRGQTVTIIASGNAAGCRIPPFYVFPGKRWNDGLLEGATTGAAGTMSESGWSYSQVFLEFLERHFLKFVKSDGSPVLILFDGHKSHINLILKEWGVAHNVVFFVIPPNTSHVTQPLDVGCFGPLKTVYYKECQSFMRSTPGSQVTRYNVASISSKAYNKGLTPDNLISSFRKSGFYPMNRSQIHTEKTAPSVIYQDAEPVDETTVADNNFLEKRKVTTVQPKPSKRQPRSSLQGNMMSPRNESLLKLPPSSDTKGKKVKKATTSSVCMSSPKPSTSGIINPTRHSDISVDTFDSDSSCEGDDIPCCICHKTTPPKSSTSIYLLKFIKWGQCDNCNGWVHLQYCTPVRVLRRGDTFLCPKCSPEALCSQTSIYKLL